MIQAAGGKFGYLQASANSVGAQFAGAVANRLPGGKSTASDSSVTAMLDGDVQGALLLGVDPLLDLDAASIALESLSASTGVIALTSFMTDGVAQCADVVLPIGWFAETSGTFVNTQGDWQSFNGAVTPVGEARPAWKVLRVLGNMIDLEGFDYQSSSDVLKEVHGLCNGVILDNSVGDGCSDAAFKEGRLIRVGYTPIYSSDMAVRQAASLQKTIDARSDNMIRLNSATARVFNLSVNDHVMVRQDSGREAVFSVVVDEGVANDCVVVPAGLAAADTLGPMFGEVTLEKE